MEAKMKEMEQEAKRERQRAEAEHKREMADINHHLQMAAFASRAERVRLEGQIQGLQSRLNDSDDDDDLCVVM